MQNANESPNSEDAMQIDTKKKPSGKDVRHKNKNKKKDKKARN
jgi:hypothetical protein